MLVDRDTKTKPSFKKGKPPGFGTGFGRTDSKTQVDNLIDNLYA